MKSLYFWLMAVMQLCMGCLPAKHAVVLDIGAAPPPWAQNGNGARTAGPIGEGFYAVGMGPIPLSTEEKIENDSIVADKRAIEGMALVFDRFWNRSLSILTQKTGAYGLFRTFEAAPCRLSMSLEEFGVMRRWRDDQHQLIYSLAFIPRSEIERQLTQCNGCNEHPVCKILAENLSEVITEYAAWSETHWQSAEETSSWVERGSGPFLDGPAGRGFYGVGKIDNEADPVIDILEIKASRPNLVARLAFALCHPGGGAQYHPRQFRRIRQHRAALHNRGRKSARRRHRGAAQRRDRPCPGGIGLHPGHQGARRHQRLQRML
jgi:hypothetical protein